MKVAESAFDITLKAALQQKQILAVLVIDDAKYAVDVAIALMKGGIQAMELALRTPASLESLRLIKENLSEMIVGVGTVLTTEQVDAVSSYADLIVTPGCNPRVIEAANSLGIPIAPGISSPTDIEMAAELGCRVMKFFPAENLGGVDYLNAINAPYDHLGICYIPLGGVNSENCLTYLNNPKILCIGGSWIAPRKLIQERNWDQITENARLAMKLCSKKEGK